jgi:hypothetical protein
MGRNFEVWVEGELGLHKGKPMLHSVHISMVKAQKVMQEYLRQGKFATLVIKDGNGNILEQK